MNATSPCPFCQETIPAAAMICGKCQAVLVSTEWQRFAEAFRWASPVERGKKLAEMNLSDRERFPLVWSALRMGPFPDALSPEAAATHQATMDAAMTEAKVKWAKALLIASIAIAVVVVGFFAVALVVALSRRP